jgi:quinol monooxygenase YgiN
MKNSILILILMFAGISISCKQNPAPLKIHGEALSIQPGTTMKMIAAKIFIKPGMEEEFIKRAKMIVDSTHMEQGCLEYTLYQDPNNKLNFLMFERYKSQAAIDAHFGASYFKAFGKIAGQLTSKPSEIKIYNISENK